ncbi:MAG: MarR family winged helix-turn-helix transcriptional regulator [Lachnospiraceae bacterium]
MRELNERILDAWIDLTTVINNERLVSEMPLNESLICRILYQNKENDITATDLCSLTKMQKSQMNRTLMNMEKKNWIIRQRSDKDKRQILIALNEEKMRAYQEQHEHILNIVNKLIERIGQENTEKTVELLNLIVQIAREEII